jgi:Fic family protein
MATHEETTYRIEPCLLEQYPAALSDLIGELIRQSARLGGHLHPDTAASLADLVRVMNCYYSNLIEGHNTRPRDIDLALNDQFADDPKRRDLQCEARAHIRVQRIIDQRFAQGQLEEPASRGLIHWMHRSFYEDAPESMLRVEDERGPLTLIPGEFRNASTREIAVGRHLPPSGARVDDFMTYFEHRYRFAPLGTSARVFATAAAHHRFNYIHPFLDGNGRVSRLMSHAMALHAGIGAHGLWSISRGLGRGLEDAGEYKSMLDATDAPRRGGLDGRGNLSQEALIEFVTWFCRVALDQLEFMSKLFELDTLRSRLHAYVHDSLDAGDAGAALADELLRVGSIKRSDAPRIMKRSERSARDTTKQLIQAGLLTSRSTHSPLTLRFTAAAAEELFPRLFPAQLGV